MLNNFHAFQTPGTPYVTTKTIEVMANEQLTGDRDRNRNILLARELTKHPEVLNAIDRHSTTGKLDGLIDRQKIQMTLDSKSPLKYLDDNKLAGEMLKHFSALRDPNNTDYINIDKLRGVAQWPTDDPVHGRLAWIAQEILKRSETLAAADGGDHWGRDGWIHKDTLRNMAH